MAIYNWPEDFDFSEHRGFLLELAEDALISPTKLELKIANDKRKRMSVTKNHSIEERLGQAPEFSNFTLCRPIDGNYLTTETEMTCSIAKYGRIYTASGFSTKFSVAAALRHVALICSRLTPQYGISHVMAPSSSAYFFLGGSGTTGMNVESYHRASIIGWYKRGYNVGNSTYGKLIDIFELNVLNTNHLERQVFGQSLASWIRSGKDGSHGELIEINSKVAVWHVPDSIRSRISLMFFHSKLTEVATTPRHGRGTYFESWVAP